MPKLTLEDIKDQVYSKLEENRDMYQEDEVRDAINEAYRIMNLFCGWVNATVPISSTYTIAGRVVYDVPYKIAIPQKVSFEGQALEKVALSVAALNLPKFLREFTADTGQNVSRWIPIGIRAFAINPADSVGGGRLEVTGIANPVLMYNDADTVIIPKEGVNAVVDYAAHSVQCKLQGVPFMQSLSLYRSFEELLKVPMDKPYNFLMSLDKDSIKDT
jgi:hypothetical protein